MNQQVDKLKKLLLRKLIGSFCQANEQQRYESLTKNIKSSEDARIFNWFKSQREKRYFIDAIQEIEERSVVEKAGQMVLELEDIFYKAMKNQQCQDLRKQVYFQKLLEQVLKKRLSIKPEDIDTQKLNSKTQIGLEKVLRPNQDFKKWCQKYKSTQDQKFTTYMQIQSIGTDKPNQHKADKRYAQLMEIQEKEQRNVQMSQKMRRELKAKLDKRISTLQEKYPNSSIAQIELLKHKANLLNFEKNVYLDSIKKQLEECDSFDPNVKRIFEEQNNDQYTRIKLSGSSGIFMIQKIFKAFLPIDVFQLYSRVKDSQFKRTIKKGLFIIGNTGVGKSTLIQHLLGYEHYRVKQSGRYSLAVKKQLQNQHKGLETSCATQSVTAHLSAYKADVNRSEIHFIDTPGFQDTNGPLVDIANKVILENAFKNCQTTCYLLLLDIYVFQTQRNRHVKKLAHNIAKRFSYESKQQLASFCLLVFSDKQNIKKEDDLYQIIQACKELANPSQKKYQIALNYIQQSLDGWDRFFKPIDKPNQIRTLISSLKFNACRKIKCQFEEKTLIVIQKCCKVLIGKIKVLESKNEMTKLRFYYSIVYDLHYIIPAYIEKTKIEADSIFQKKSRRAYNQITKLCLQMVKNPNLDQLCKQKISSLVFELTSLNQLSEVNQNIKSQKQLQQFVLNDFAAKLKELVGQKVESEKIKDHCQIILFFHKIFPKFLASFFKEIEEFCYSSTKNLQTQLSNNFNNRQINMFDQNLQKYQKFLSFYTNFAQKNQLFKRKDHFPSKQKILEIYLNEISKIHDSILGMKSQYILSLEDKNVSTQNIIMALEANYQKYLQYCQIITFDLKKNLKSFQHDLEKDVAKKYQSIYNSFQQYFQSAQNNLAKENLHFILSKLIEGNQAMKNSYFKEKLSSKLKQISQLFVKIQSQAQKKMSELQQSLENIKEYKEATSECFKDRIQALEFFKRMLQQGNCSKLSNQYENLKKKIEQTWQKIYSRIEKNVNYSQSLHFLRVSASVSNVVQQFYQGHKQVKGELLKKLIEQNKKMEEMFSFMKLEKKESIKKNFSKTTFQNVSRYVSNIFKPIRQSGLEQENAQIKYMLLSCFTMISKFFEQVNSIIDQNKQIQFPSTHQSKFLQLQTSKQNQLIDKIKDYVKAISHIYQILIKYVISNENLTQYFERAYSDKVIQVKESKKQIEEIFYHKTQNIKKAVKVLRATKSNFWILNCILKEFESWKIIQIDSQDENLKANEQIKKISEDIRQKLRKIQGKQASEIQKQFDGNHRIKDVFKLLELYLQFRKNSENSLSEESTQYFSKIQQNLQNYIRKIETFLEAQYAYELQEAKGINGEFISIMNQLIQLYQELSKKIEVLEQSSYQKTLLKRISKSLQFMLGKIKQQFKQVKERAKAQIDGERLIKAKKSIKKLQIIIQFMKKFKNANITIQENAYDQQYQKIEDQIKAYQSQIKQLNAATKEKMQKLDSIIQKNTIQRDDLIFLQAILQNSLGKDNSLMRKIKYFVQRQFKYCQDVSLELKQKQQRLLQFQEVSWKMPQNLIKHFEISKRIDQLKAAIRQEQLQSRGLNKQSQ